MLNRRIIRGKVMQQIFAYEICKESNIQITKEQIINHFQPDLNSLEPQNAQKLEGLAKLTLLQFEEYLRNLALPSEAEMPKEVNHFVKESVVFLNKSNLADKKHVIKKTIEECESVYHFYLLTLNLLAQIGIKLTEARKIKFIEDNIFIKGLIENPELNQELIKQKLSWENNEDLVGDIIMQILTDETYKKYAAAPKNSVEKEREFVIYLFRGVVFKNERFQDHFNNLDLNWDDDKIAVKDMVGDTLKNISPTGELELGKISKNWDDDKQFLQTLFENTIDGDRKYEEYISPKLENWDISRLTSTDRIIIKMCVGEMINFPNIPVKVSINEYIELSKKFSTPKSKQLVNGVLDSVSIDLLKQNIIKKSGRGLMDNK
ncbi:MAG: transcription antitermination factor NusB [Bacteroidetes bacterium]|nr:MAG: transcription antitermination factor NusB [Bacteroidota bacterium]